MEKEQAHLMKNYDRLLLQKETLESDVSLMNEQKKQMACTVTKQQQDLEEQKRRLQSQINEVLIQKEGIKATEIMCLSLQEERDKLLEEVRLIRQQLASVHKAKDIIYQSFVQLKADHVKHIQENRIKENTLKHDNAQLDSQLQKLDVKYKVTASDLDKTRLQLDRAKNEAASLRSLLKQSNTALECVTFRDEPPRARSRHSFGNYHSSRMPLPSSPSARPQTASTIKHVPCFDSIEDRPSSVPMFTSNLFNKEEGDGSRSESDGAAVILEGEIDQASKFTHAVRHNSTVPKDPPILSPKDPDGRSVKGETSSDDIRNYEPCALFQLPQLAKSPVDSIGHDQQADDISAISEIISRHDLMADQVSCLKVQSDSSTEENIQSKQVRSGSSIGIINRINKADKSGDNMIAPDESTEKALSNSSAASVVNTTQYSESFQSENEADLNAADKMMEDSATDSILHSSDSKESHHSELEPSDTPRSMSSTSSGGYTASFCTEE
jgi:hypothetical protein